MGGSIIQAIVTSITGFLAGMGEALVSFFNGVFTSSNAEGGTGISNLGIFLLTMVGIGFAMWAVRQVLSIIRA